MTRPTAPHAHLITRRSFCTLSAVALASLALPARRAFGDEAATAATATQPGAIVIVHTNDVHCAVDDNLGYAKLVNYAKTMRSTYGADNVTLVDAGDAVQGKAMGTLTNGEYLIDVMNECGYDFAIPGNHEFDYGMTQFNTLVARANAKYLSCNFTDLRTGNLMFDAYAMREYDTAVGKRKVAYLGICTPESLTKSSPAHFQEDGIYRYGFCEDDSGTKLYDAVQSAVDQARADGADYVVALAHLGQDGVTPRWTSTAVAANTSGIDVIIDGHSHELYVQTPLNKNGQPVLVTQTGTQLVGIGQVVIDPANGTIAAYASNDTETVTASTTKGTASIVKAWDGIDADTAAFIAGLQADLAKITERVIGRSDVRLVALEDDDYTWAVRAHETNLGDFVADAYLALAWHGGVMADIGFVNGGGIRANIEPGDVTYGDLINVQPYNNQLCYVDTPRPEHPRRAGGGRCEPSESQRRPAARVGARIHRAHGHSVVGADAGWEIRRRDGRVPRPRRAGERRAPRREPALQAGVAHVFAGGGRRRPHHVHERRSRAAGFGQQGAHRVHPVRFEGNDRRRIRRSGRPRAHRDQERPRSRARAAAYARASRRARPGLRRQAARQHGRPLGNCSRRSRRGRRSRGSRRRKRATLSVSFQATQERLGANPQP